MTDSASIGSPALSDPPAPPPRPLTGHLRYRALAAKPVSMLLLTSLIIVLACAYTARHHFRDWARIRRLKTIGRSVEAVVTDIFRARPRGERGAALEYVQFEFHPLQAPQTEPVTGRRLHSLFNEPLRLGSRLTVAYDPAKPEEFFCPQVDDSSVVVRLSVQLVFLIAVALLLFLAVVRYFILLNVAGHAPAHPGTIAAVRTSAQGAFSRLVVFTFRFADRTFVLKRVVPVRLTQRFSVGDPVWLLVPPRRPSRAIIAAAFL